MGLFGSKKKNKNLEEVAVAIGTALHLDMSEKAAAIAAAIYLHGSSSRGRLTIRRSYNSPWRDIKRARSMERL